MSEISETTANGSPQPDAEESHLVLDNFQATVRKIRPDDSGLLYQLTVSVFWPHRDRDLDLFISLGHGYLAIDEIGRPMGSAMYFPMGDDFSMFGMMITAPRLQTQGAGRWLLSQIMADCAGSDLRLNATRAAYWLYETEGFVPVATIWQHQGIARDIHLPTPVAGIETRVMCAADTPAILALDGPAFGADRSRILTVLLGLSEGRVAVRDGEIVGYALIRHFGRGKVIGPVIAEDERIAMQLIAPLIQANVGTFLRLDVPLRNELFASFLAASGMGIYDTVTEMRIGPQRRATEGAQLFGLSAHSLG
ncbi:GNAT family N-acetyltransferase [Hoeflea sp. BAL378]|uniref:GNAT family N-acetyltransferase n=1 Tax=Hoeflea sp. BAL378 TaxID=1547437 RepID=UPI00068D9CA5|nr:GNAT family N-acetyltransferase [Hoeflea sp. BAL378]